MRYLTEKMRKRDMAANAVLAAGLIGNLQSPQHFVRSGHIEAPGVQLMQRMMKKRKEANRNLDSGVVAQGARNRSNVSAPSTRKRMATAYDRMKKQKREKADEIIRDLRKEQKTFQDFMLECYKLEESSITQQLKLRAAQLIAKHRDNPEKVSVYKTLINRIKERETPTDVDYPGRESARRDKRLYPSHRMSSHPNEDNPSTRTKNPKKLRKQRALGEIL